MQGGAQRSSIRCAPQAHRGPRTMSTTPPGGRHHRCAQRDRGRRGPRAPAGPPPYSLRRGAGRGRAGGAAGRTSPPALRRCRWGVPIGDGPAVGLVHPGRGGLSRQRPDPGIRPRREAGRPPPSSVIALQRRNRCRSRSGPPATTSKEHAGATFLRTANWASVRRRRGGPTSPEIFVQRPGWGARAGCAAPRVAVLAAFSARRGPGPFRWGGTRRFHCRRR